MIYLYVFVCFYSGQLSHLPSCFVAGVANLNLLRVFAASPLLRVFRAIVNKKQCDCEARRLCMSLVVHYWRGDVQDSQGVSIPPKRNY